MRTSDPKHQMRWRMSEQIAAELSCLRRESGCHGWDEFFRTMIRKSKHVSSPSPSIPPLEWLKPLLESNQDVRSELAAIRGQLGAMEGAIKSLFHQETQTNELVRRFNTLLAVALEFDPKELDEPSAWSVVIDTIPKDDVLNKVRRTRA